MRLLAASHDDEALAQEVKKLSHERLLDTFGGNYLDDHQVLGRLEEIVDRYKDLLISMGLVSTAYQSFCVSAPPGDLNDDEGEAAPDAPHYEENEE